ncbi:MAG: NAD(P)H-binding protein, partial [Longimicrobiales bacterium]|nr:NAD(P)H-binding protein [Longimicrobiales bacterium]
MNVLVTGATGYIGGRLVPLLLAGGHSVRVLVRDSNRLASKPWADAVEVVQGDVHDPPALETAVEGMDAANYLIHSMCTGPDFATRDRRGAETFVEAGRGLR